jgi:hypothetical protein
MLLGGSFAQTTQLPSAIPSGTATNGQGPYDFVNLGTSLKTYKMIGFESQPGAGPDTSIFRDYTGHLSIYDGAGVVKQGGIATFPGSYQGTTAVGITDTAYHVLIAASNDILIAAGTSGVPFETLTIHGDGVYTTAAASLLNAEAMLCQVSGCASGTVVAPAGCTFTTTNQANNLANGQFTFDCRLVATATVGASGTFMAKGDACANLGAALTAVLSCFADTATAASAAVNETVNEYINIGFKFTTSNAGNSATLLDMTVSEN